MGAIFISVRSGSTRLPNKANLDICGKPSMQYLIDTLKHTEKADEIILCTTRLKEDDQLCRLAKKNNIKYFRGSSEDKLLRWLEACKKFNVDFFVNVDGDDIFFDYGLADMCFAQHRKRRADFIDGHGLYNDVYGITFEALKEVCDIKGTNETEYIRSYFLEGDRFDILPLENIPSKYLKQDIRMTLDYPEDLIFFTTVIQSLKGAKVSLTFDNILFFLSKNPEVKNINFCLDKKWKDNQKKIITPVFKT